MKRFIRKIPLVLLMIFSVLSAHGASDENIINEKVANQYRGNGDYNIKNADFQDVSAKFWAKDEITKLTALGVIRGYESGNLRKFSPNGKISREEAIALILRLIGKQEDSAKAAEGLKGEGVKDSWSNGYLSVARNLGLISSEQYTQAMSDANNLDPSQKSYRRNDVISREEVAVMLAKAVAKVKPEFLNPIYEYKKIFNVSDYANADVESLPYIETIMRAKIMEGDGRKFYPKNAIKRSEMAKVLVNMEKMLYDTMGVEEKSAVVGVVMTRNNSASKTNEKVIKVRNDDGEVDELIKGVSKGEDEVVINDDCVVLADGRVGGLSLLREGDKIKYIVDKNAKKLIYVSKNGEVENIKVTGSLQGGLDLEKGLISIKSGKYFTKTYKMRKSLYDMTEGIVIVGEHEVKKADMPYSNIVTLTVQNGLVVKIEQGGGIPLYEEISGTIKDVNPKFKYITITDINGREVTKQLSGSDYKVERVSDFIDENKLGHIDEIFDENSYDRADANLEDLEAGDIVHIRITGGKVSHISAKSFTTRKVGKLVKVKLLGDKAEVILDDGVLLKLDVMRDTLVKIDGKNVSISELKVGQKVEITINDAVIDKGRLKNIVKKIEIFTRENKVKDIYKSGLGVYNDSQNTLSLISAYKLMSNGFKVYEGMKVLPLAEELEIVDEGKIVSLDYLKARLEGGNKTVYTVSSDYYGTEKIVKLLFDKGRARTLDSDIVASKKAGMLILGNSRENVSIGKNAIVVKDGYLLNSSLIQNDDKVQVVLGRNDGLVFNVLDESGTNKIKVYRGRIKEIEEFENFVVDSLGRLDGFNYDFSPIDRAFVIDDYTKIISDNPIKLSEFIDYGEKSQRDEVFTILAEGDYAKVLIKNNYAKEGVKCEVISVNAKDIEVKDTLSYDSQTKRLEAIDLNNTYAKLITDDKTIFIKNGEIISIEEIRKGDMLEAISEENLRNKFMNGGSREVNVSIVFVK